MEDHAQSTEQLLEEIQVLRHRVAELEAAEAKRERAEQALQAAKQYAETLINSALDIIISVDANRKIMGFNPAAERAFGYSREEVIGQPIELVYVNPEESTRINACIAAEGKFVGEVANRKKNGEIFFCYLSAVTLPGEDGKNAGVMGISCDVTARKQAEEALRQAEVKYRGIFENAIEGIFQTAPAGHYLSANPALARIVGYESAEELRTALTDIGTQLYVNPSRRAEFVRLLQEQDAISGFESQVHRKDGRIIWIAENARAVRDGNGALLYYEGTAEDITERKRAEETQARLTAILDATPDFVGICNLNGRALYINRAGKKMVGMGEEESPSATYIYDYHPEWVRVRFSEILPLAMRDGVWSGETALLHRDGHEIPVSQVILTHKASDGTIEYFSTVVRDISARKAIERQRAEFVAMLTHDIKNPLAAILGYVDLLYDETEGTRSTETNDFLQRLKDNALTIYSLIANYLDLARVEAGSLVLHKTPESLAGILRRVVDQYGAVARRHGLSFTLDIRDDLPLLFGDALALERVFANLVRNALKFTPEHGRVTVSAQQRTNREGKGIVVEVRDTGPGIAPEMLPVLFEKYRRVMTTSQHEGTGLGLFIVKTLVEAHQGRVEIESQLGAGTCVRVMLPAASSQRLTRDGEAESSHGRRLSRTSAA